MIGQQDLQKLRDAIVSGDSRKLDLIVSELGNPSTEEIVNSASALLTNQDRNLRVLAVRVLSQYPTKEACEGLLQALSDPERRVRAIAAKCSKRFLHEPRIADRLRAMVCDDSEKRKIRSHAFEALNSPGEKLEFGDLPESAVTSIKALMQSDGHRWPVLVGLLQMELNDGVEELLQAFVKEGSREEAIMATRGLCGYRIVNIGKVQDQELKSRICAECDIAVGRVFYWVSREVMEEETSVC